MRILLEYGLRPRNRPGAHKKVNRKPEITDQKNTMKKLVTILIASSLALTAGVMAQQDEGSPGPKNGKKAEHRAAREAHANRELKPANQGRAMKQDVLRKKDAQRNAAVQSKSALKGPPGPVTHSVTKAPANEATLNSRETEHKKKERNNRKEMTAANTPPTPAPTANANASTAAMTASHGKGVNQQRKMQAQARKPDRQKVKKIKAEHANFKAQPKPEKVPAVTFRQDRHINGSEHWQGEKYVAFRNYRPERHDRSYYHSRYHRIELIGGGYYYWNNGYWYPAWGYDPSAQYYAYDGPIYVGSSAEPPDQVIADVQAVLQEQGYYRGEVDGLLGPLTREALSGYQADNGLYVTEAIDQPTLDSLGID